MPKYIDTDNILQGRFTSPPESEYARGWNDGLKAVAENAPTADVVPVVRGKWIWDGWNGYFLCSNCKSKPIYHKDDLSAYCPNCGADMRRGKP